MIPFARIINYGNVVKVPKAGKLTSMGMGRNSNGGGNWVGAILGENGNLYGMGNTKMVSFSMPSGATSGLELVRRNVKNYWILSNSCLVLDNDGTYWFSGAYGNGIFTSSSASSAPYRTTAFVNVSSYFTNVGEIVDAVIVGAYDKGPADSLTSPAYTVKYSPVLAVVNTKGEVWYMGTNGYGLINGVLNTSVNTTFVKDTQLTQKAVSLRSTIDMSHLNTYYTNGYGVLYAKLEDGSLVGKGYNIHYGITTPATSGQNITTWTRVLAAQSENYDYDASNEGIMYCNAGKLIRNGTGGGYALYISGRFYYYQNYNVGMSSSSTNSVNSVGGQYNVTTTGTTIDGTSTDIVTSSNFKVRMSFCGSVLFESGSTRISVAHGVYTDYYSAPAWDAGYQAVFKEEDIGIPVADARYVGGTLYNDSISRISYGLVIISTEGKVYWRGVYNGVNYNTLTEIILTES